MRSPLYDIYDHHSLITPVVQTKHCEIIKLLRIADKGVYSTADVPQNILGGAISANTAMQMRIRRWFLPGAGCTIRRRLF